MRDYRRTSKPTGVLVIILINVVVFILTELKPDYLMNPFDINAFHLALQPETLPSQPWTLMTSIFVHANIGHILFNMITLYFFGSFLTMMVGEKRFLITYFIGGLAGNALWLIWATAMGDKFTWAVGASGAIFAVGGALAVLGPNIRTLMYFIIPVPLWVAVMLMFVMTALVPGVAWQAHLGGLLVGLAAGFYFKRPRRVNRNLL